jgi:putative ABC transport system permease protein
VLRAVGLNAAQIVGLFVLEATLISAAGMLTGLAAVSVLIALLRAPVENNYGIPLASVGLSERVIFYMVAVVIAGAVLGLIPAIRAYRNALVDGLTGG